MKGVAGRRCARRGRWAGAALMLALGLGAATPATAGLASGPYSGMRMKLERSAFRVDVLTLDLRFAEETRQRLQAAAAGRGYSRTVADAVADAVMDARTAAVRIAFHRRADHEDLVEAVRDNVATARAAGAVEPGAERRVSRELAGWLDFLSERGVKKGDSLTYQLDGATLRLVYRDGHGRVLTDARHAIDEQARRALLAGYVARGSEFREPLVRSLLAGNERGGFAERR